MEAISPFVPSNEVITYAALVSVRKVARFNYRVQSLETVDRLGPQGPFEHVLLNVASRVLSDLLVKSVKNHTNIAVVLTLDPWTLELLARFRLSYCTLKTQRYAASR